MEKQIFLKSPIKEAVFQIIFKNNKIEEWDNTILGEFYSQIKSDFPDKKIIKSNTVETSFDVQKAEAKSQIKDYAEINRFIDTTQNKNIELDKNNLSVHIMKYDGWGDFSSIIKKVVTAYLSTYSNNKSININNIERMGIRYINLFSPKEKDFDKYFNFLPMFISENKKNIEPIKDFDFLSFVSGYLIRKDKDFLKIQLVGNNQTNTLDDEVSNNFIVDLDFFTNNRQDMDNIENWIENAHQKIEDVFFSCINQNLYNEINQ